MWGWSIEAKDTTHLDPLIIIYHSKYSSGGEVDLVYGEEQARCREVKIEEEDEAKDRVL